MTVGKALIAAGLVFILLGVLVIAGAKLGLGRLPGDVTVRGKNYVFYFPLATSLLLSALLSLAAWFFRRPR